MGGLTKRYCQLPLLLMVQNYMVTVGGSWLLVKKICY